MNEPSIRWMAVLPSEEAVTVIQPISSRLGHPDDWERYVIDTAVFGKDFDEVRNYIDSLRFDQVYPDVPKILYHVYDDACRIRENHLEILNRLYHVYQRERFNREQYGIQPLIRCARVSPTHLGFGLQV